MYPSGRVRTHRPHLDTIGIRADDPRVGVRLDRDRSDLGPHHEVYRPSASTGVMVAARATQAALHYVMSVTLTA